MEYYSGIRKDEILPVDLTWFKFWHMVKWSGWKKKDIGWPHLSVKVNRIKWENKIFQMEPYHEILLKELWTDPV